MDKAGLGSPSDRSPVVDETLVRIATSDSLRDEGFDVIEAEDADEALRLLSAVSVDAVFSDTREDEIRLSELLPDNANPSFRAWLPLRRRRL